MTEVQYSGPALCLVQARNELVRKRQDLIDSTCRPDRERLAQAAKDLAAMKAAIERSDSDRAELSGKIKEMEEAFTKITGKEMPSFSCYS